MFYVQNWDSNPQNSAFQTLQQQLVSIKKSLQYYDASTGAKKDSYLLTELGKIQKLAYIIRENLKVISANPSNKDAANFLVHGNVQQLPAIENGLKLFSQIESAINKRVGEIQTQYDSEVVKVQDPKFKEFLGKVKNFASDETNIYGSRCGSAALKVIDIYSKYINPIELSEVKDLKSLQCMETSDIQVLDAFEEGIDVLRQSIVKSLRDNEHRLYFCFFDNSYFKDVGGWQHPYYGGHAFVIEKTAEDKFRVYQGYLSQYSLKSFLTKELQNNPDGLKDYEEFYTFLKDLQVFSYAKKWDHDVNEAYKSCFGVDHKSFLGESVSEDFFKLRFSSMQVHEKEYVIEKEEIELPYSLNKYGDLLKTAKSVAVGVSLGGAVSSALYVSYYAVSSLLGYFS